MILSISFDDKITQCALYESRSDYERANFHCNNGEKCIQRNQSIVCIFDSKSVKCIVRAISTHEMCGDRKSLLHLTCNCSIKWNNFHLLFEEMRSTGPCKQLNGALWVCGGGGGGDGDGKYHSHNEKIQVQRGKAPQRTEDTKKTNKCIYISIRIEN